MTDIASAGHIFLVGFMGAGKSTVGVLLADVVGRPFVDLDVQIEAEVGRPVARIFVEDGEEAFRDLESEALERLADSVPSVVACGGGIVLRAGNRRLLKELGVVVFLEVSAGVALARIGDVEGRPLLAQGGPSTASTLLHARTGVYHAVADITVDTDACEPFQLAEQIVQALASQAWSR